MNIFRKKFIPIKTLEKKIKNKNHHKNNSLIKRTNSQILFGHKNENELNEDINMNNTIQTRSLKYTISEDPLYLEQKNYDIESSNNLKIIQKTNKSNSYLSKSSSNKSGSKISDLSSTKNKEQNSNLNISESFFNKKDLNSLNNELHKKGLIYNYNQMNNYIKNNLNKRNKKNNNNNKAFISQSYTKYLDLINKGRNNNSNNNPINLDIKNINNNDDETISTNDLTKLKCNCFITHLI